MWKFLVVTPPKIVLINRADSVSSQDRDNSQDQGRDKMLSLLIFAVGLLQSHAVSLVNSTGTVNEQEVCQCSVILPDNTFPADRLEAIEISNQKLSISVNQEITRIQNYQATLTEYIHKLKNLTRRVEIVELGGISYTELDFELLKLEIREMESLVIRLKQSINGSSTLVESLFVEIHNISVMVNQLESYDKNNVLAVRREIAFLRKKLEECEKNPGAPALSPPVSFGTCNHGGLKNISKPFVVQLNWQGFNYKFGGWGKDSFVGAEQDTHWVAPLTTDSRMMNMFRYYPTYDDLLLYKKPTDKVLTKTLAYNNIDYSACGQGGGMVLFNNSMYYNCYNTRDICKYKVDTGALERKTLTDATFNNRFSYASTTWQDIDLASDEYNLWVIYSTEQNSGNMLISKLNSNTLTVEKTWSTDQYKPAVTNAFMVCGVLYATRTLNTRKEEIFYMYDTNTNKEGQVSIVLDKMMENVQSVSYNPNDHKLYMYNDGYLVNYDLTFKPQEKPT
ncbi:olfactomedin-4-like [Rana temporaria]|uniref:olfactomedin-4-like n=1 Tax=Rana temporaria TaxID=8407 RepID=UPI001AADE229|nr:olfactomedin-4-like [Rana temporaria]